MGDFSSAPSRKFMVVTTAWPKFCFVPCTSFLYLRRILYLFIFIFTEKHKIIHNQILALSLPDPALSSLILLSPFPGKHNHPDQGNQERYKYNSRLKYIRKIELSVQETGCFSITFQRKGILKLLMLLFECCGIPALGMGGSGFCFRCSGKGKREEINWIWCFRAAPAKQLSLGQACGCEMSQLCFRCSFLIVWFDVPVQMKS